jgi:hypothetical protein
VGKISGVKLETTGIGVYVGYIWTTHLVIGYHHPTFRDETCP